MLVYIVVPNLTYSEQIYSIKNIGKVREFCALNLVTLHSKAWDEKLVRVKLLNTPALRYYSVQLTPIGVDNTL